MIGSEIYRKCQNLCVIAMFLVVMDIVSVLFVIFYVPVYLINTTHTKNRNNNQRNNVTCRIDNVY